MKRIFIAVALGVTVGLATLAGAGAVQASSSAQDAHKRVSAEQTVNGSWYASGETVTVDGTVRGDVYCGAQNVIVTGTVEGDVICGAQQIEISGNAQIAGNVRLAGQNIRIRDAAVVERNASIFGQTVEVDKGATVKGDLNGAAQTVTVAGVVGRDVMTGSQQLRVTGAIGRNVDAQLETLQVAEAAKIGGNIHYSAEKESQLPKQAIAGEVSYNHVEQHESHKKAPIAAFAYAAVVFVLLGLVIALVVPRFVEDATEASGARFGFGFLTGLVASIVLPVIAFVLFITMVLWPVGIAVLLAWGLLAIVSVPLFSYMLGRVILQKHHTNVVMTMALGTVVVALLCCIPIVNIIVIFVATVTGVGLALLQVQKCFVKPNYAVETVATKKTAKKA